MCGHDLDVGGGGVTRVLAKSRIGLLDVENQNQTPAGMGEDSFELDAKRVTTPDKQTSQDGRHRVGAEEQIDSEKKTQLIEQINQKHAHTHQRFVTNGGAHRVDFDEYLRNEQTEDFVRTGQEKVFLAGQRALGFAFARHAFIPG